MSKRTGPVDTVTGALLGASLDRRSLLQAAGVTAAAVAITGCSSTGSSSQAGPASAGALASTTDIPVGGGLVIEEPPVVITQPTEGDFKGFTAICPHQGCLVSEVAEAEIVCRCHGSTFSIVDGAVIQGPASQGLGQESISVKDGSITLA